MNFLQAGFLGLLQGLTEFLPVSSSGHLALFQNWFGLENTDNTLFTVLLHFATLIAVCVAFRKDILDMLRELGGMISDLTHRRPQNPAPARRMILLIVVGSMPLVLILLPPIRNLVDIVTETPLAIGLLLCVTGVLLFLTDRLPRGHKTEKSALVTDGLMVGLSQCLAIMPGLSRSGATISTGLFRKFNRAFAVRFSFLLSLPAVLGATLLELKDVLKPAEANAATLSLWPCIVGMLVAAIVGYFAIGLVRRLIDNGKFGIFAYYCLGMGIVTIAITMFTGNS